MLFGIVVLAIVSILSTALIILCALGIIPRNSIAGLRLPAMFASDKAWMIGHRAGILPAVIASIVCIIATVIGLVVPALTASFVIVIVALLGGLIVAAILGSRAASRVAPPADR
ncbi:hypothetical protein GCM10027414_35170 [Humibacter ginsengiterrae]